MSPKDLGHFIELPIEFTTGFTPYAKCSTCGTIHYLTVERVVTGYRWECNQCGELSVILPVPEEEYIALQIHIA